MSSRIPLAASLEEWVNSLNCELLATAIAQCAVLRVRAKLNTQEGLTFITDFMKDLVSTLIPSYRDPVRLVK